MAEDKFEGTVDELLSERPSAYSILDRCYQDRNFVALEHLRQYLYQVATVTGSLQEEKNPDQYLKALECTIKELRKQGKNLTEEEQLKLDELVGDTIYEDDKSSQLIACRTICSKEIGAENLKAIEDYLGLHNLSDAGLMLVNYDALKEFHDAATEYRERLLSEIEPDVTIAENTSGTCSD